MMLSVKFSLVIINEIQISPKTGKVHINIINIVNSDSCNWNLKRTKSVRIVHYDFGFSCG